MFLFVCLFVFIITIIIIVVVIIIKLMVNARYRPLRASRINSEAALMVKIFHFSLMSSIILYSGVGSKLALHN